MLLRARDSVLLIVDVQQRLFPAIHGGEQALERIRFLMQAAAKLDIPILVTEHYSKGLGHSVESVLELAPPESVIEKIYFSAPREPEFAERISRLERNQIVVCGCETHVCVLQSAMVLAEKGYHTSVVADAVGSRRAEDKHAALSRMQANGLEIPTSEMVVFEWLERGGTDAFRSVIPLIK